MCFSRYHEAFLDVYGGGSSDKCPTSLAAKPIGRPYIAVQKLWWQTLRCLGFSSPWQCWAEASNRLLPPAWIFF